MSTILSALFSWRGCVASKDSGLKPPVRLVALTLSLHMNEKGGSCFPSISTLVDESGLARSTVQDALHTLSDEGWLTITARTRDNGGQTSNTYDATFPARFELPRPPAREAGAPSPNPGLPPAREPGAIEGVTSRATVEVVHSPRDAIQETLPDLPPPKAARCDKDEGFDQFWDAYPRKVGKPAARKVWQGLNGERPKVMPGLAAWKSYWKQKASPEFVPYPATWLNQHRWADSPGGTEDVRSMSERLKARNRERELAEATP